MPLFIIFSIIAVGFGWLYLFCQPKFSFDKLLFALWSLSIGIAQLRLSPYEAPWTIKFWVLILLFFVVFYFVYRFADKFWQKKIPISAKTGETSSKIFVVILSGLTFISIIANIYIFSRFGTLPILSTIPDKMRFIINREVFGLWEYAALLPRIFVPLAFVFLLTASVKTKSTKIFAGVIIIIGLIILSLYASRVTLVFVLLLCFFSYLISKIKEADYKKIIAAAALTALMVLIIAVSIPAIRQYITYRDYYTDIEYDPFTYLADLSDLKIPASLNFVIPIYLIPAFNLQAMMRATDFFPPAGAYFGVYSLSVFPIFDDVIIPWKALFLPWWVTATFLFSFWVDFGWLGIALAAAIWGILLSLIYQWAIRRPNIVSVMMFAYFCFVVIMSIYTNYLTREEFYLDVFVILVLGLIINLSRKKLT